MLRVDARIVSQSPGDPEEEVVTCFVLEQEIVRGGEEVRCFLGLLYTHEFMLYT